jgi:hypothetical protein
MIVKRQWGLLFGKGPKFLLDFMYGFLNIRVTTNLPDATGGKVIVVTKVVLWRALILDEEGAFDLFLPLGWVASHDFEVINVHTNVVIPIFLLSRVQPVVGIVEAHTTQEVGKMCMPMFGRGF